MHNDIGFTQTMKPDSGRKVYKLVARPVYDSYDRLCQPLPHPHFWYDAPELSIFLLESACLDQPYAWLSMWPVPGSLG